MLQDGGNTLYWAAFNDHVEVVKLLVKHGADIGRDEVLLSGDK